MKLAVDRDSVSMGDDINPHRIVLELSDDVTVGEALLELYRQSYYARIGGGRATWVPTIGAPSYDGKRTSYGPAIAVVAQEWGWQARFVVDPNSRLTDHPALGPLPTIFVTYHAQKDPERVLEELKR